MLLDDVVLDSLARKGATVQRGAGGTAHGDEGTGGRKGRGKKGRKGRRTEEEQDTIAAAGGDPRQKEREGESNNLFLCLSPPAQSLLPNYFFSETALCIHDFFWHALPAPPWLLFVTLALSPCLQEPLFSPLALSPLLGLCSHTHTSENLFRLVPVLF